MSDSVLRVLIADRNPFYRRVLRQNLNLSRPLEMFDAESSLESISLLLTQPFNILLADWEILTSNDGALLELISRRAKLARRKMPTLALMNQPTQSSVLHASNNSIEMVLRKPFSPKQLQARTRWLLDRVPLDAVC
jgi:DNA-binding response OmpR family regulator